MAARKIKADSPKARTKSQSRRIKAQMPVRIAAVVGGTPEAREQIVADVQSALNSLGHVRKYPHALKRNDVTAGPLTDEDADIMIGTVDSEEDDDET